MIELLQKLIRIKSISPSDMGCFDLIENELKKLNFKCERINYQNVENLYATIGSSGKLFCYLGPSGDLNGIAITMILVLRCALLSSLLSRQSLQICRGFVTNLRTMKILIVTIARMTANGSFVRGPLSLLLISMDRFPSKT